MCYYWDYRAGPAPAGGWIPASMARRARYWHPVMVNDIRLSLAQARLELNYGGTLKETDRLDTYLRSHHLRVYSTVMYEESGQGGPIGNVKSSWDMVAIGHDDDKRDVDGRDRLRGCVWECGAEDTWRMQVESMYYGVGVKEKQAGRIPELLWSLILRQQGCGEPIIEEGFVCYGWSTC